MKRYSEEHVWIDIHENMATVGLTSYAAQELGELTFVELPDKDTSLSAGDVLCVVESAKAASDVVCPVSGTVSAVNDTLEEEPTLVNASPEDEGWICKLDDVDATDIENLLDEDEYDAFLENDDDL